MTMTPPHTAPAFSAQRARLDDYLLVSIDCPYCDKSHQHGWPEFPDPPGNRIAHCRNAKHREYEITIPDDLPIPLPPKRGDRSPRFKRYAAVK